MRRNPSWPDAAVNLLGSSRFVAALVAAAVGVMAGAFAIRQLIGWPGLIAMLIVLAVLMGAALWLHREQIGWQGLLPVSLMVFLGWSTLSLIWSQYQWASLGGLAYLLVATVLGLGVALLRDTIQVIRAFGGVFRVVLGVSLVVEIFAGALIDSPIPFLGIAGNLDSFGPLQGILGSRNQFGMIALLAVVTFAIEYRTRSIARGLAIGSLALAGLSLVLARSPVAFGVAVVVAVAAGAIALLRRTPVERRRVAQVLLLAIAVATAAVVWALRVPVVNALNATGELTYRLDLWRRVWDLIAVNPLQGWGWVGAWHPQVAPFVFFQGVGPRVEASASNAYLDIWFQLGLVGLAVFLGLLGLAFVRSWLLASRRRSEIYAWPALVLVALLVSALAESAILVEFGWLTFVVCATKAAQQLSWRQAFARTDEVNDVEAGRDPGAPER